MIPQLARSAVISVVVAGTALGATISTDGFASLRRTNGPSLITLSDSNSVPLNSPGIVERSLCVTVPLSRKAAYQCGDLTVSYELPAVRIMENRIAPKVTSNSQLAHPIPLVTLDVAVPSGITVPDSISYIVKVNGTVRNTETLPGSTFASSSNNRRRIQVGWDAYTDPTDVYPVVIQAKSFYPGGLSNIDSVSTEVIVVNRVNSPVGLGWWIDGVEQIKVPSNNTANRLWIGGDGSARIFRANGTNKWTADTLDRPDNLTFNGTTYSRRVPGGTVIVFNSQGQHIQTLDPRGYATNFYYKSSVIAAPLDSIKLPRLTKAYQFVYTVAGADTVLDKVYSPWTSGTQTTEAQSYGSVLYQFFDPRGSDEYYEVAQSGAQVGRIIYRREKGGTESKYVYDAHAQLSRAVVDSSARRDTTTICPFYVVSSPVSSCGTRVNFVSSALLTVDGPGPNSPTPDVTSYRLQRFRTAEYIKNALNQTTLIDRTNTMCGLPVFPAYVFRLVTPDGLETMSCPDSTGNKTYEIVYNANGPGANRTTYTHWDSRWDKPTWVMDNISNVTFVASYDAYGNVDSIGDGRNGSATRFYYGGAPDSNLLQVIKKPVTRGSADDFQYINYDALGNRTGVYELTDTAATPGPRYNQARHYTQDAIGRTVQACIELQVQPTSPPLQCTSTTYDVMSRDSVVDSYADAYGGAPAQATTVRKYFGNEGELVAMSREKTGSSSLQYTRFISDRYGRITKQWNELNATSRNDTTFNYYGAAGNLDSSKTRQGKMIRMTYDVLGRLIQKTVPATVVDSTTPGNSIGGRGAGAGLKQAYPWRPNNGTGGYTMAAETYTYTYDVMGRMLTATNNDSRVARTYTPLGWIKTDSLEIRGQNGTMKKYGLLNNYDPIGRRTSLHIPAALATGGGSDSIRYNYVANSNDLDVITDPSNNQWNYDYSLRGDVEHLSSAGPMDQYSYFNPFGSITFDQVVGPSSSIMRYTKLTYDSRNQVTQVLEGISTIETSTYTYSGFGHLLSSWNSNPPTTPSGTYRARTREDMTYDAIGNIMSRSTIDSTVKMPGATLISTHTKAGTSVLDPYWRLDTLGVGFGSYRSYTYDVEGNVIFYMQSQPTGGSSTYQEDRVSYYDAEGHLRAADFRRGSNVQTAQADRVFEQYKYDALGRRVWVRTDRRCVGAGKRYEQCDVSTLRKTIWDGDEELIEIQTPIKRAQTANILDTLPSSDTDNDGYIALWKRLANGGDPNQYFGRVLYINGIMLDKPLAVVRYNYSNASDPANDSNFVSIPIKTVSLQWDATGHLSQFHCADFGSPLQCTGTRIYGGTAQMRFDLALPRFVVDRPEDDSILAWHGTLINDKADGTRTYYRRNRYYDPSSGQFTQEDPIGFNGGLNLYAFADGDGLNQSDAFGLCPEWINGTPCAVNFGGFYLSGSFATMSASVSVGVYNVNHQAGGGYFSFSFSGDTPGPNSSFGFSWSAGIEAGGSESFSTFEKGSTHIGIAGGTGLFGGMGLNVMDSRLSGWSGQAGIGAGGHAYVQPGYTLASRPSPYPAGSTSSAGSSSGGGTKKKKKGEEKSPGKRI